MSFCLLPWVASPNFEFAYLSGGKGRPLPGPDQSEPQDRVGSLDLPVALTPCSCFGPKLSTLSLRQKVGLHQLLLLPRPQGTLWVCSQAVCIPSTSASEPVTVSAWLRGPAPRFKQATFPLRQLWGTVVVVVQLNPSF